MNTFRTILFVVLLITISCKQTEKKENTSNQDIYDFMKIVINEQQLDKSYAMDINPRDRFSNSDSDGITFDKTLFEIQQKEPEQESFDKDDFYDYTFSIINNLKKLTVEDISEMKHQKKQLTTFKWDNSRLGFNQSNEENWYAFSVPLFSKDRTKAVMMIKDLCPGLCGAGKSIFFSKENGKWTSSIASSWFH